jgi:hypothetical protein
MPARVPLTLTESNTFRGGRLALAYQPAHQEYA